MKQRADGRWPKVVTINGEKKFFYSKEPTEKRAIKDINRQMIEYTEKQKKGRLFEDVAREWEEVHYPQIEYTTSARYKTYVNFIVDYFDGEYIKKIKTQDIQNFLMGLAETGKATKTIKDQLSVIRMIFKHAMIKQYIDSDPVAYTSIPKGKKAVKTKALTEEQVEIVKQSVDKPFGLFPYFLMYTGLRRGEALAIKYGDIDFEKKIINVEKSVYHKSNAPYNKITKTDAGTRTVVLLDCLAEKLPKNKNPNDYIFPGSDGGAMRGSYYARHWNKWRKVTGLDVTSRQLRHTYATILFEAEIDVKDTQHLMGHKDITTTRNIYTHIRENHKKETAQKINDYIQSENTIDK